MDLPFSDIKLLTQDTKIFYNNKQLISFFKETKLKYIQFLDLILNNPKYNGLEKNNIESHNPLLWEAAHPIFFLEKHCVRYLYPKDTYPLFPDTFHNDLYDSFIIPNEYRFTLKLASYKEILDYYDNLETKIIKFLEFIPQDQMSSTYYYMIMFVLLHIHMHLESFLFTNQFVYKVNPFKDDSITCQRTPFENQIPISIEFIKIPGGTFWQGYFNKSNKFAFDNESPNFKNKVNPFSVSKTLITHYMFKQFVDDGCYKEEKYWSFNGNLWRKHKLFNYCPMYWHKLQNKWHINYFDELIPLEQVYNHPIIHISWYEAEAFCKWVGGRMMKEPEWEYLATNASETYYPWGDSEKELQLCNLNYSKQWVSNVTENNPITNNKWGVEQLIGNCWEWCKEIIYPYDGFNIDPLYRESSYPFFGYKKICRGGAWCVPDYLISSYYRNSQEPDSRKQYIGFRVVI